VPKVYDRGLNGRVERLRVDEFGGFASDGIRSELETSAPGVDGVHRRSRHSVLVGDEIGPEYFMIVVRHAAHQPVEFVLHRQDVHQWRLAEPRPRPRIKSELEQREESVPVDGGAIAEHARADEGYGTSPRIEEFSGLDVIGPVR